jgi:predicted DNA-binding transcriptional regulator AlpA
MKAFSTREAAKKLGLHHATLARYLKAKKVPAPTTVVYLGETRVYAWRDADIERVRKILPKIANGRKTRYKKKKK